VRDAYRYFPFLPDARVRAQQLGVNPASADETILSAVAARLQRILSGNYDMPLLSEKSELLFFALARAMLSALDTPLYYDRFGKFYARRAERAPSEYRMYLFSATGLGDPRAGVPLATYMSFRHVYPETKLYHLPVSKGVVFVPNHVLPALAGAVAYSLAVKGLPIPLDRIPESIRKWAKQAVPKVSLPRGSGQSGRWGFIESILKLSGIPDGRKRIVLYWIMPYLITVKGLDVDTAVSIAKEWAERQGAKILESWLRSDAENVKRKGLHPWSPQKVRAVSPDVFRMLQEMGVFQ